jgi:hypothetical protein
VIAHHASAPLQRLVDLAMSVAARRFADVGNDGEHWELECCSTCSSTVAPEIVPTAEPTRGRHERAMTITMLIWLKGFVARLAGSRTLTLTMPSLSSASEMRASSCLRSKRRKDSRAAETSCSRDASSIVFLRRAIAVSSFSFFQLSRKVGHYPASRTESARCRMSCVSTSRTGLRSSARGHAGGQRHAP